MLTAMAAALLAISSVSAPNTWPENPPPDKIIIDVATVNGTGCPPESAASGFDSRRGCP